jgi:predicted nucleic acid-binding Zn ribbon protein
VPPGDDQPVAGPPTPDDEAGTAAAPRSGVDVAREALAAARAEARRRGLRAGDGIGRKDAGSRRTARRSGSGPDDRDPQPIGRAIGRLLADRGWEAPAAVGGVTARWGEIVGAEVAGHCTPAGYAEGVLTVAADSTAWATQMRLLAPSLVRRLNTELGEGTVVRVDVRGPTAPSWQKGRLSVRGRGPRDTYG